MVQNKLLLSLPLAHKHKTKYQMEIMYHTRELFLIGGGALPRQKIANSDQAASSNDQDVGEKQKAQINFEHKLNGRTDAVMMVCFLQRWNRPAGDSKATSCF